MLLYVCPPHLSQAVKMIREDSPRTNIIIEAPPPECHHYLSLNIAGLLEMPANPQQVVDCLVAINKGLRVFPEKYSLAEPEDITAVLEKLNENELKLLKALAKGVRKNKEAACLLSLGTSTINNYKDHIIHKLSLQDTGELYIFANKHRLVIKDYKKG
jgi:DNA-binding NarL/FixJ family response regulator